MGVFKQQLEIDTLTSFWCYTFMSERILTGFELRRRRNQLGLVSKRKRGSWFYWDANSRLERCLEPTSNDSTQLQPCSNFHSIACSVQYQSEKWTHEIWQRRYHLHNRDSSLMSLSELVNVAFFSSRDFLRHFGRVGLENFEYPFS